MLYVNLFPLAKDGLPRWALYVSLSPLAKDAVQRWALHCTHRLPLPENASSDVLDPTFVVWQGRGHTDFPAPPAAPHHVKVIWLLIQNWEQWLACIENLLSGAHCCACPKPVYIPSSSMRTDASEARLPAALMIPPGRAATADKEINQHEGVHDSGNRKSKSMSAGLSAPFWRLWGKHMSQASLLDVCMAVFDLCFSHYLPFIPLSVPFFPLQKDIAPNGLWPTLMSPFQLGYSCKDPSSKQRSVGGSYWRSESCKVWIWQGGIDFL